jgi:hypothetical protein
MVSADSDAIHHKPLTMHERGRCSGGCVSRKNLRPRCSRGRCATLTSQKPSPPGRGQSLYILNSLSRQLACHALPAAREYEAKLKAEKEKKARESVPHLTNVKR